MLTPDELLTLTEEIEEAETAARAKAFEEAARVASLHECRVHDVSLCDCREHISTSILARAKEPPL